MKRVFLSLTAMALSGCYSMQGSERILDRNGYVTTEVPANTIFRTDFENAYKVRQTGGQNADFNRKMLSSGFTHVYTFCDNYFDRMGVQQRKSRVARDAIAPITALITGVIALQNFDKNPSRKENMLALLGLSTAASASALDIYEEHMLFGAENIGSVETLTLAALSAHMVAVGKLNVAEFDAATRHLVDNQSICSPQHILTLTREAIKEGRVAARQKPAPPAPQTDENGQPLIEPSPPPPDPNGRVDVSIDNGMP